MIRLLLLSCLISMPAWSANKLTVESGATQTAVVELYTSEGCSSCPPADKWFEALTKVPEGEVDVLALAFHVDYWDYIGWKDRFANPKFTSRQRQLGTNNLQRSIYTPEFFVSGKEARGTRNVLSQIKSKNQEPSAVKLKLSVSKVENALKLELEANSTLPQSKKLHHRFFVYESQLSTDVKRGENAGEVLNHEQVVRYMSPAIGFKETDIHSIDIDPDWKLDNIGVAALVTSPGGGEYIQAVHTSIASLSAP